MEGALALLPFDDWTGMIEAALRAELGAEAVWLYPTELLSDALALEGAPRAPEEAETAEQAGTAAPLAALTLRLAEIEARLAALAQPFAQFLAGTPERLARIEVGLETLLARLDAGETRHDLLGEHLAEHLTLRLGDRLSDSLGARALERAGAEAAFEETLGLALAEFLARIERAIAEPPARPH